ncbi:MAG: hypothetical protein Q4C49_13495 [Bacillota bacterium]|nr:hypothetical protein [Bacillota bacterium]
MKGYNKKRKIKNNTSLERFIVCTFFIALVFYLCSITFVQSYNVSLQNKEQELAKQIIDKKEEINQLKIEINNLEEKSRIVSLLGDDIQDNSDNIYIINE